MGLALLKNAGLTFQSQQNAGLVFGVDFALLKNAGLTFQSRQNAGIVFDADLALLKNTGLALWDRNAVLTSLNRNTGLNLVF